MARNHFNKYGGSPKVGGMGGGMGDMLKQAQKMQEDMARVQAELEEMTQTATAGGGAVSVVVSGKKEVLEITIAPEVVDADDVEMLQDLIIAAVNEAMRKVDAAASAEMSKVTGGMSIPGLF